MSKHDDNWFVYVKEYDTEKRVKRLGPMPEWKADKVEDGINININHDKYYTELKQEQI